MHEQACVFLVRKDFALEMAAVAPSTRVSASYLRHAQLLEKEVILVDSSKQALAESRVLLGRVDALLRH